jgi:hypothetical protein
VWSARGRCASALTHPVVHIIAGGHAESDATTDLVAFAGCDRNTVGSWAPTRVYKRVGRWSASGTEIKLSGQKERAAQCYYLARSPAHPLSEHTVVKLFHVHPMQVAS